MPKPGYTLEPPMGKDATSTDPGPAKAKPSSSGEAKKKSTMHPDRKNDCCCYLAMLPCMCCLLAPGAG